MMGRQQQIGAQAGLVAQQARLLGGRDVAGQQGHATAGAGHAQHAGARVVAQAQCVVAGLRMRVVMNTGIGCGLAAAMSHRARPPFSEPVKPTA